MKKYNLPSLSIIAISSIVALSSLTSLDASAQQIYQWKDEKGRVHFGERPPRDKSSEKVDIKVPKYIDNRRSSPKEKPQDSKSEANTNDDEVVSQPPVNKERMKKREADYKRNCQNAKKLLAQMNSAANTRFTMPDGSVSTMPAEERKKQIAAAKASMEFYCK